MISPLEQSGHGYEHLKDTFEKTSLFEDKTWKLSPHAWPITRDQLQEIETLGQACLDFYKALETLYVRSTEGKKLLRNKNLIAPWVADYLDRGKPHHLIKHGRCKVTRGQLPSVIRPDLLLTEEGFAMTEIDSVPGGIGLTAFLNRLYSDVSDTIIGGSDSMLEGFYQAESQGNARSKPRRGHDCCFCVDVSNLEEKPLPDRYRDRCFGRMQEQCCLPLFRVV